MNQTFEIDADVENVSTSWNVTWYTSKAPDENLRSRNFFFGATGLALNIGTIVLLSLNRKIKLSLRVTIVGLLLNDVIFVFDFLILGVPKLSSVSSSPACWAAVFILIGTLTVSYLITTLLTVHNYVAVFYPFSCSEIVSPARSLIGVCVCWVGGYVICLAYLGTHLEPDVPCLVLVVISRRGLIVGCSICAVLSAIITVLNIKILYGIKNRRKIVNFEMGELHDVNVNKTSSIETEVRSDADSTTTRINGVERTEVTAVRKTGISKTPSNLRLNRDLSIFIVLNDNNLSQNTKTRLSSFRFSEENRQTSRDSNLKSGSGTLFKREQPVTCSLNRKQTIEGVLKRIDVPSSSSRSTAEQLWQLRTSRRDNTSFTLVIMTFWSCLLTFPMLVQMVYGAVLVEDRLKFTTSILGLFISSLMSAHALSNPLLFAWRFGGWRALWGKLKTCCRC